MHHRTGGPTAMLIVERFGGLLTGRFVAAIPTKGMAPVGAAETLPVPAIRS